MPPLGDYALALEALYKEMKKGTSAFLTGLKGRKQNLKRVESACGLRFCAASDSRLKTTNNRVLLELRT